VTPFILPALRFIAARSRGTARAMTVRCLDTMQPEPAMKKSLLERTLALGLALFVTLGAAGAIDHLASTGQASAVWAQASMCPRV
jgi:hypothetical protein